MTSVAATTVVGLPSAPINWSPSSTSPMVVQPVGVGSGVSRANAFPTAGLAATMIRFEACSPEVRRSSSGNPVATPVISRLFFFFNDTATTEIYTLSLHDALPISRARAQAQVGDRHRQQRHR